MASPDTRTNPAHIDSKTCELHYKLIFLGVGWGRVPWVRLWPCLRNRLQSESHGACKAFTSERSIHTTMAGSRRNNRSFCSINMSLGPQCSVLRTVTVTRATKPRYQRRAPVTAPPAVPASSGSRGGAEERAGVEGLRAGKGRVGLGAGAPESAPVTAPPAVRSGGSKGVGAWGGGLLQGGPGAGGGGCFPRVCLCDCTCRDPGRGWIQGRGLGMERVRPCAGGGAGGVGLGWGLGPQSLPL